MSQEDNVLFTPSSISAFGNFDSLRILDHGFTVTAGESEYVFETPKDALGRIMSVNGNGKNREIVYENQEAIANNIAGVEYEQEELALQNMVLPVINHVRVDALSSFGGIYRLSVSEDDCTLDLRAIPFFFFDSWEGTFEDYVKEADGSASVTFSANRGTGDRHVQVFVCVGDGLGQTCRKSILLEGAY